MARSIACPRPRLSQGRRRNDVRARAQTKGKGFGPKKRNVDKTPPTPPGPQDETNKSAKQTPRANNIDTMPPVVSDRILRRALGFCTGPLVVMGIGIWFSVTQLNEDQRLPPVAVGPLTLIGTILAALGLTYGAFSASWDPKREGSLLGWEECKRNLQATRDNQT